MIEKNNKKIGKIMLVTILTISFLTVAIFSGCIGTKKATIVVISRESTSGTREFFWDHVLGKEDFYADSIEKTSNGEVYDTVKTTPLAIGYVGLGYIKTDVKALKIDGVAPSTDTVLDGSYRIARELYMFTKGEATGIAKDFIDYLLSSEGQAIVEEKGFVPLATSEPFNVTNRITTGTLDISGSTTVLPIALAIQEEYVKLYPGLTINILGPGSSAGITAVSEGTAQIGMSSRGLKDTEKNLGLVNHTICSDGIAIIVHPSNNYIPNDDLTMAQLKTIYTNGGDWTEI